MLLDGICSAIRNVVVMLDVEHVVIGGGMAGFGAPLLTKIQQELARWGVQSPFIAHLEIPHRVTLLPGGTPVGALGATVLTKSLTAQPG